MATPSGFLDWNIDHVSAALKIRPGDVREYFTDGRRVSFLIERRIAYEVLNGTLAGSEGASYDVLDADGQQWEVRSVSRAGVYFCPSYMVGSGRRFEELGFLSKLREIAGYILADIVCFPSVPYWQVTSETVERWWSAGSLGTMAKISRARALHLLENMP